MKNWDCSNYC